MGRYFLCILSIFLLLTGCGGGDESSISSNQTQDKGSGSVAVMLTDGPAEKYDHIWVWITEISLLPDGDDDPVVIFESDDPEGWKVDLLDLRDQEAVVTVKDDIPAGQYRKIRLHIADIMPEGDNAPCNNMELELPDGKIDLEPKDGIEVVRDETIAIHIDIDCDKSIDLQPVERLGKCFFRPKVFVEIDRPDVIKKCPRVLKGKIKTIQEGNTGFTLRLGHGRGLLTVNLADDAVIFGENGISVPPEELARNQWVHVRGQLDKDGNLQASVIVIGHVLLVKGIVETPYDAEVAMFSLNLMLSKYFPKQPDFIVDIDVSEDTLVMTGCDQMVDPSAIEAGMKTRVVAKLSTEDWSIKAIAVLLKDVNDSDLEDDTEMPTDVTGVLMDASGPDGEGGYGLLVESSAPETYEIYLPAGVEPTIEIPEEAPLTVPMDELQALTGCVEVSITVDSQETVSMTASDVLVNAAAVSGFVEEIVGNVDGRVTVELDTGERVTVINDSPWMSVEVGNFLDVVGLNTCEEEYEHFLAIKFDITQN